MNKQSELIARTMGIFPSLPRLEERLADAPEEFVSRIMKLSVPPDTELPGFAPLGLAGEESQRELIGAARRAFTKIRKDGRAAKLDEQETAGLEAIVMVEGRPALLIEDGVFEPPPPLWQILEQGRADIEKTLQSVGRIEVEGHPRMDWLGTGFLVGPDVIMTNRHVAMEFCIRQGSERWTFDPAIRSRIDYMEEYRTPKVAEYELTEVLGIVDSPGPDLALLRVASAGPQDPNPLVLASKPPSDLEGHRVYIVGYPAMDPYRNDPEVMRRIFANIYGVKRLQPGEIRSLASAPLFQHDCSTLGGNSGSCVVDLETHQVLGLHFRGRYLESNDAVALWTLTGDRLLRDAGVNFAPKGDGKPARVEKVDKGKSKYAIELTVRDVEVVEDVGLARSGEKQLRAAVQFELSGPDAQKVAAARTGFRVEAYTVPPDGGEGQLTGSTGSQFEAQKLNYTVQVRFPMPAVGQHELQIWVLTLPPTPTLTVFKGPTLRVVP